MREESRVPCAGHANSTPPGVVKAHLSGAASGQMWAPVQSPRCCCDCRYRTDISSAAGPFIAPMAPVEFGHRQHLFVLGWLCSTAGFFFGGGHFSAQIEVENTSPVGKHSPVTSCCPHRLVLVLRFGIVPIPVQQQGFSHFVDILFPFSTSAWVRHLGMNLLTHCRTY